MDLDQSFDDLINNNIEFIKGNIKETIYHLGPLDEETLPHVDELININNAGYLTVESQPGLVSENLLQRGYLKFYTHNKNLSKVKNFIDFNKNYNIIIYNYPFDSILYQNFSTTNNFIEVLTVDEGEIYSTVDSENTFELEEYSSIINQGYICCFLFCKNFESKDFQSNIFKDFSDYVNKKYNLLAFGGRKQSGKNVICSKLEEEGYEPISFAYALKKICCETLNIDNNYLELNKDIPFGAEYKIPEYKINDIIINIFGSNVYSHRNIYELIKNKRFRTIRDMLQFIGTDIIRKYNENWHINKLLEYVENNPDKKFCIMDMRFKNEKKILEEKGFMCFYIIRPYHINDFSNHNSEIDLNINDFPYNNIISNNKDLNAFEQKWSKIYNCLYKYENKKNNSEIDLFLNITNDNIKLFIILKTLFYSQHRHKTFEKFFKYFIIPRGINYNNNKKLRIYKNNIDFVAENLKLWNFYDKKFAIPDILKNYPNNKPYIRYFLSEYLKNCDYNDNFINHLIEIY